MPARTALFVHKDPTFNSELRFLNTESLWTNNCEGRLSLVAVVIYLCFSVNLYNVFIANITTEWTSSQRRLADLVGHVWNTVKFSRVDSRHAEWGRGKSARPKQVGGNTFGSNRFVQQWHIWAIRIVFPSLDQGFSHKLVSVDNHNPSNHDSKTKNRSIILSKLKEKVIKMSFKNVKLYRDNIGSVNRGERH